MRLEHNGVTLEATEQLTPQEITEVMRIGYRKEGMALCRVVVEVDGDFLNVYTYKRSPRNFDRIRRITGYLVGTLDRFNDGKKAEEADRVKHQI